MITISKTRKRQVATAFCNTQINAGRKVLKAKTRKQALALLKKIPHITPAKIEGGLAWWDKVQWLDSKSVNTMIEKKIPAMRAGCIRKHMS